MTKVDWLNALIALGAKLPALFALIQQIIALFAPPAPSVAVMQAAKSDPPDALEQDCCDVMAAHAPAGAMVGGQAGTVQAGGFLSFLAQLRQVWSILESHPELMAIVQAILKGLGVA